ncbi:FG-GAP repeat domain-containing protein [Vibrio sp. RC27]
MRLCQLHFPFVTRLRVLLFVTLSLVLLPNVKANELTITPVELKPNTDNIEKRPGQIPLSRIAYGDNDVSTAWYTNATERYPHGILGDESEAATLNIETREGKTLEFSLPNTRVFEDLEPRVIDLDGDGIDEIITIESDTELGASLSLFQVESNAIVRVTSTPFIGRSFRWLNPIGVGDFDGDSVTDIALVVTPHIGGKLHVYRYTKSDLTLLTEYLGVSNHRIGSTELGLGAVAHSVEKEGQSQTEKDLLIVPDQAHQALVLLEWENGQLQERSRVSLPSRLETSLTPAGPNQWTFTLINGQSFTLTLQM